MPWMTDEEYEYTQDCKEKKITARSARHMRTHNGKSGAVKLPSDYLSKKELRNMNGPVESYRMNDPMTWEQFKKLPDDLKVTYVKALREKYKVPDSALAEAMGISTQVFGKWMRCYGLGTGKGSGAAGRHWYGTYEHNQFVAWWNGVNLEETVKEAEAAAYCDNDIVTTEAVANAIPMKTVEETEAQKYAPIDDVLKHGETRCVVPSNGYMTFEGNIDDILRSVRTLLDGRKVHIKVEWDLMEE